MCVLCVCVLAYVHVCLFMSVCCIAVCVCWQDDYGGAGKKRPYAITIHW